MMVWLVAIVSILLFGGMGVAAGLAPAACGLVALVVALLLGGPLTSLVGLALPKSFTGHALANWFPESVYYMELVLVLLVFYILFWGGGFWVRSKIDFWLKHCGTEIQRVTWKYLNHGVGLLLGLVTSVIFVLILAAGAYAPGYLSTQTTPSEQGQPWGIAYLNLFSKGMKDTGLDKIAARWDRTPKKYYETCDLLGLIINNPTTFYRVTHYPLIYAMMDRQEVGDLAKGDSGFKGILDSKAGGWAVLNDGGVLSFMNSGSYSELKDTLDLKDFAEYLNTGKSPKYDRFKLLGEWDLDISPIFQSIQCNNPNIDGFALKFLRYTLVTYFKEANLRVTVDKKLSLRNIISGVPELVATLANPSDPKVIPPTPTYTPEQIQQMQAQQQQRQQTQPQENRRRGGVFSTSRYREAIDHNARTQQAMNAPAPGEEVQYDENGEIIIPEPPKPKTISVNGSWSGDGELYKIKFGNIEFDAIIEGEALTLSKDNVRLYFVRKY